MTTPFTLDGLKALFQHMEWADGEVWLAALAHPGAVRDARLRDLLLHLHVVQRAFLHVWTSRAIAFPDPSEFPEIAGVKAWAEPYYADVHEFLSRVDERRLSEPVEMPWVSEYEKSTGRRFETPTLGETMFQVTSHSTYHRGQVNARLREVGGEPALVDFIAWVWFGKPQPQSQPTV